MKRHVHHLEEVARHFTPPLTNVKRLAGVGDELIQKTLFGITTIELRCRDCGDVKRTELIGDAR